MQNLTQRPALGQIASIGSLYNARNDSFLPLSLLNENLPSNGLVRTIVQKTAINVSYVDSYVEKFERMGIGADLGASILAGLVDFGGCGCYLSETRESDQILHAALHYKITSFQEKLNFASNQIKDCLTLTVLENREVTHVVVEVEWGTQSVVTARHWLMDSIEKSVVDGRFRTEVEKFKLAIESPRSVSLENSDGQKEEELLLEISAYGDLMAKGVILHNLQEAYEFIIMMASNFMGENGGKGKPIAYKLLPIEMLSFILTIQVTIGIPASSPSAECLKKFVHLFDELRASQRQSHDYWLDLSKHKSYIPENQLKSIEERVNSTRTALEALKMNYARVLQDVRGGADPVNLWKLLEASTVRDSGIATITDGYGEKVNFIKKLVAKGATYIGYNGLDLEMELSRHSNLDAYVLRFSEAAIQDQHLWMQNQALLLQLFDNNAHRQIFVAIVDCDASATNLEKAQISHYRDGQEISNDLLELKQFLVDNCFLRYIEGSLEKDVKKPVKRRFVKIPCPGRNCSSEVCYWICSRCLASTEYGWSDRYIYCDCGRALYSNYAFKCNSTLHGSNFDEYTQDVLLPLLQRLDQSNYLNILILGETGVGKSTFINAFINYLTFETLDDSMKAEKLNWVVPCSFSTQIMNRLSPDGKIEQKDIKVGSREDEQDGSKGASATQQTSVYPITIGSSTVRLIDTPGIGDTRGISYDQKNMADILSTLSSYDELHGILILLKSNNARLTITFTFCVTELLTHLHRNAAKNMVFGFTNTRISNYTPGDTFGPLTTLLKKHSSAGLSLSFHTTYCFDSESFRYLAAYKNGISMGNEEDFRRSWKHSRDEALRLLDHFRSRSPHIVKSTISLNGTRQMISELTKPMAEISQLVRTNIAMSEDKIQELKNTRLSGDKLRKSLHLQKVLLKSETLSMPRTVCKSESCTEFKDDGNGESKVVTIYRTHCHSQCFLTDVKADCVAHPGLIHCAAFQGSEYCTTCNHHWQEHLHVLYELREHIATVKDSEIERQLSLHADDVSLKQTAIEKHKKMTKEYRSEHEQLQKAAAQFGIFLKKNSITAYNDATLAYLDLLIEEEHAKVQQGGNRRKLHGLKEDRQKHVELVEVLTLSMANDTNGQPLNEADVEKLVRRLYNLKHFGSNLESIKRGIVEAHEATYREMPFRVQGHGNSIWKARAGFHQAHSQSRPTSLISQQRHNFTPNPSQRASPAQNKSSSRAYPQTIVGKIGSFFS